MKTKTKLTVTEKATLVATAKPKSLRPMRSMVAVRSLKSKTSVAHFETKKTDVSAELR